MAFLTSSGSLSQASIMTAKSGVDGISEHNRFCFCCADIILVVLPGFDGCKAFSFRSSTGISFVRSCDCPFCDSICPGFDRFCPDVNCVEMVEAAGIEAESLANKGLTTERQKSQEAGQIPSNSGQPLRIDPVTQPEPRTTPGQTTTPTGQPFAPKSPPRIEGTEADSTEALLNQLPTDLTEVIKSWGDMPDALKSGILAMIRAAV